MGIYSERAKRNSRLGIELRMKTIETRIIEIKKEIQLFVKYRSLLRNDTKWITRTLYVLRRKLKRRNAQLQRYKNRKARLKREGKI